MSRVSSSWEDLPPSELVPLSADGIAMPFVEGEVIADKYQIVRMIGSGGMGYVLSAIHLDLGEPVALKFLRPEALKNEELVARFAREAQAAARIKGEHVARVFDVSRLPDGTPFIVMEHLEGKDLCDFLGERGALPVKVAVDYVLQACEGLASAHSVGIIHRDIKPENLFLAGRSQGVDVIKVLDFGISKIALTGTAFTASSPMVKTQMPMGSPVYMSPEQIRDSEAVDARTDIWSLGCVLMELLTAKAAFDAPSIMQLSAIILERDAPKLRSRMPEAPAELEAVIARCLERDVNRRFQSVAELAVALYHFGSRRARLSAERCCHLLQGTGDFELPTMPPPTSNPGSMPNSRILLSQSSADVGGIQVTGGSDSVPTSSKAAVTVLDSPAAPAPAHKGSSKFVAVAIALVVGAAGAYAFATRNTPAPVATTAEASRAAAQAPGRAIPEAPAPIAVDEAPKPAAPAEVAAEPEAPKAAPGAKKAKRAVALPKAPLHKDKPAKARSGDDVDVGF